MPRFYFHLRAGEALHRDVEGGSWPTVAGAYGHALEVAKQHMRDAPEDRRHWSLRVVDENAATSFEVSFADVAARFGCHRPFGENHAGTDDTQSPV